MNQYVIKLHVAGTIDGHDESSREMRAAAHYYNALVAIERWGRLEYRAIRSRYVSGLGELDAACEQLSDWIAENRADIREKRQRASVAAAVPPKRAKPTKKVDREEEVDEIGTALAWLRDASTARAPLHAEFESFLSDASIDYEARTRGVQRERVESIVALRAAVRTEKSKPSRARLAAQLKVEKAHLDADSRKTHAKRAANGRVLAEMLSEPWHPAWKDIAMLDAAKDALGKWTKDGSCVEESDRYVAVHMCSGTYTRVAEDVARAGKRPPPRPDGKPRRPKPRPAFSPRRFRAIGRQLKISSKVPTWGDVLAGKVPQLQVTDAPAYLPRKTGKRNPQRHSAEELARRAAVARKDGPRQRRVTMRVTFGCEPITLAVLLHRPIPKDARIPFVYLVPREEWDGRWSYSLQLNVQTESPLIQRAHGNVDTTIRFGWSLKDGGLCVAKLGTGSEIVLPAAVVSGFDSSRALRGASDVLFDEARSALLGMIPHLRLPEWVQDAAQTAPHWRRHGRLVDIAVRLVAETPLPVPIWELWQRWKRHRGAVGKRRGPIVGELSRDLFASRQELSTWLNGQGVTGHAASFIVWLDWWRRKDRHLKELEESARRRATGRRRDVYRCAAARLCTEVGTLTLEPLDLARVALRDMPEDDAKELHQAARRQRVVAAIHELKLALKGAFGPNRIRERSRDAEDPGPARNGSEDEESSDDAGVQASAAE